jgi:hypothetical protein
MTTTIKVTSHNYPARVEIVDKCNDREIVVETRVLTPEDGEVQFYCTTTRQLRITDLEYDDPAAVAAKEAKAKSASAATAG